MLKVNGGRRYDRGQWWAEEPYIDKAKAATRATSPTWTSRIPTTRPTPTSIPRNNTACRAGRNGHH